MLKGLWRDQRGTASIEAAVVLPLMALCWAGLFLRVDSLDKYLDAAAFARRDAWNYSAAGCEDDHPPSHTTLNCMPSDQDWMKALSQVPLLGSLIATLVGFELTKIEERQHNAPALLGGKTTTIEYSYYLMCNEKSRDGGDVMKWVLCQETRNLGLSLDFALDCPPPPPRGSTCPGAD